VKLSRAKISAALFWLSSEKMTSTTTTTRRKIELSGCHNLFALFDDEGGDDDNESINNMMRTPSVTQQQTTHTYFVWVSLIVFSRRAGQQTKKFKNEIATMIECLDDDDDDRVTYFSQQWPSKFPPLVMQS
jgi:hypothetical protein